ncbi:MAG: aminotransferase class I/II-fold pyridoxal phosphate-dependent enzyme [Treponemataceae bacterium]
MNSLAHDLNGILEGTVADSLLSDLGRRMYFPKGIIAQSAEAKKLAHRIDATIGIATEKGEPLYLKAIRDALGGLAPKEAFPYAPTAGIPPLREVWKQEILKKNPSLGGKGMSLPVVVTGLTHAIAVVLDLFANPGDTVIIPDFFWDNYELIASDRLQADVATFPFFTTGGKLNVDGLVDTLRERRGGKAVIMLNFPNNPTGYTLSGNEAERLVKAIREEAEHDTKILIVCDDAYYGLFFEDGLKTESLFADLADLHPNVLAVKTDAATKEELVWGFRVGFITYGSKNLNDKHYDALIQKTMGLIRSSISCSGTPQQYLVLKGLSDERHEEEKKATFKMIETRYRRVKELVKWMRGPLKPFPFNSGYFMTFRVPQNRSEDLRQALLKRGVGTISIRPDCLRVAYSSVDVEKLDELFGCIDDEAVKMFG